MASHRSSLRLSPAREGAPTTFPVPVVAVYTFLALPVSLVAATANLGAWFAAELLKGSGGKDSPVAQVANVCNCCRDDRKSEGKPARKLKQLPIEVTQDKVFEKKGLPVFLCTWCDGEAYEEALRAHQERA